MYRMSTSVEDDTRQRSLPEDNHELSERSKGGGDDGSHDTVSNGSSSSSASTINKRRQKRARRTRAAQRKMQACVDAADYDTQQILAREDERKMRAQNMEGSTPSSSRGFGRDVTNRGVVGTTGKCRTGDVSGEAPRSPKGKLGRRDSVPGHPKGRKPSRNIV